MSVVRRCSAGAVVAGLVLLGGPAWAQEADPCAPGPDGSVPEMCQSGPGEPSATPTVGIGPEDPCTGSRPSEPGDGQVVDGDPGSTDGGPAPEPDVVEEPAPAPDEPAPDAPPPGSGDQDGIICAFDLPVDASAGGAVLENASPGQLPRTGPYDRLLALTAVGGGLVVVGAGAVAAGRRRSAPA